MRSSIFKRTFRYFLVSMGLIILLFAFFFLNYVDGRYRESFASDQQYVVNQTADAVENLLMDVRQNAYYLCANEILGRTLVNQEGLSDVAQRQAIESVLVLNTGVPTTPVLNSAFSALLLDGQFPIAGRIEHGFSFARLGRYRLFSGADAQGQEWYEKTLALDGGIHAFTDDSMPGEMFFAHALRNVHIADARYGNRVGVMLYAFTNHTLSELLHSAQNDSQAVTLLLQDNMIAASTDTGRFPPGGDAGAVLSLGELPSPGEAGSWTVEGTACSVTSASAGQGWRVIYLTPSYSVWRQLASLAPLIGWFGLAMVAAVLAISAMFARRISAPIQEMTRAMIQDRDANVLPAPIAVRAGNDEIGQLCQSYNDIVKSIHRIAEEDRQKNAQLRETELKALQSQINPHFIYNTLDSVACIALVEGQEDIASMVDSLVSILKYSIRFSDMTATLSEEINYLRQYISIQEKRYHGSFRFECDIPEKYDAVKLPKLIIQPLVENALFYAENREGIVVRVFCEEREGTLLVHVCDNGTGADAEKLNEKLEAGVSGEHYGIGIVNVNRRIRLMMGDIYGLHYEKLPEGGLDTIIALPLSFAAREEEKPEGPSAQILDGEKRS